MSEFRLTRLGEQVREEISQMILRQQIKDPPGRDLPSRVRRGWG